MVVSELRPHVMDALGKTRPGGRTVVVTCCRKGAHRSVSAAVILAHMFEQRLRGGVGVLPTDHTSRDHLWKRDYCGECTQCCSSKNGYLWTGA